MKEYINIGDLKEIDRLPKSVRRALCETSNLGTLRPNDKIYMKRDKANVMIKRIKLADAVLNRKDNLSRLSVNGSFLIGVLVGQFDQALDR